MLPTLLEHFIKIPEKFHNRFHKLYHSACSVTMKPIGLSYIEGVQQSEYRLHCIFFLSKIQV